MAKIDCSVTVNYSREYNRMCKCEECYKCPANITNNGTDCDCDCGELLYSCPEVAIEIVQRWSDEHPVKARLDDLLEKYPKVYISSGNTPSIRPYMLGYCENCDDCGYSHCEASECWHEPVYGGATGKAVE